MEAISGIVVPWAYIGGLFSTFCWHYEDLFLYSINFMHEGVGKTWYTVPLSHTEKMRQFMRDRYAKELQERKYLLTEVVISFSPLELIKEGIPVYKTYQQPGEMIITFPGAFHGGFSNGYNIAEAVNLATPDWLVDTYKHDKLNKYENYVKKCCFSLEWLVTTIVENIEGLRFSKEGKIDI